MLDNLKPYAWLFKIGLVLLATVLGMYMWHVIAEKYREEGRSQLRPQLEKAVKITHDWKNAYSKLNSALNTCNHSVRKYLSQSAEKQDQSKKLIEVATRRSEKSVKQIENTLLNMQKTGTCEQAVSDIKKGMK